MILVKMKMCLYLWKNPYGLFGQPNKLELLEMKYTTFKLQISQGGVNNRLHALE